MKRYFLLLPALLAVAVSARAQGPDPADAAQTGSTPSYRSAFDGYLPYREPSIAPAKNWRAANDEAGRLGGHAGHISAAAPAAGHEHGAHHAAPQVDTPPPAPAGGHHHAH